MGRLFRTHKSDYAPDVASSEGGPFYLTKLRKDALQEIFVEHNDYTAERAAAFADECFNVWTRRMHATNSFRNSWRPVLWKRWNRFGA